ncbi:WD40/YVTN/BNR-like repeat-containing protein [Hydrocarboniphaga sp.]|uniref:WD40/YVTN/BNR-like repeat-containing protein n=1 Tax=Hydrocarboniphaga sp. TaxID=2033016 RepID=UPI003D0BADA9
MLSNNKSVAAALLLLSAASLAVGQDAAPAVAEKPATPATIPALATAHAQTGLLLSVARAGSRLIAVGGNGVIVKSEDGRSWSQVLTPIDLTLTGVAFGDADHGWAVGHDALILHTRDAGLHWEIQNYEPDLNAPFFAVIATSSEHAVAVGAFGLMRQTDDGGRTWTPLEPAQVVEEKYHLNAATLLPGGAIAVAGERGLVVYQKSPTEWARSVTPYDGSFFGVLPWGQTGAVAFGMRGNVFVTDDLAQGEWRKVEAGTAGSLFGGEVLPDGSVALVGAEGQMIRINHAGVSQPLAKSIQVAGKSSSLAGAVIDGKALVVVGELGVYSVPLR